MRSDRLQTWGGAGQGRGPRRTDATQAEPDHAIAVAREAAEAERADAAEQARQRATTAHEGAVATSADRGTRWQAGLLARLRAAWRGG